MTQKPSDAVNLKELLEVLNSRDYEKKIHSNGYGKSFRLLTISIK